MFTRCRGHPGPVLGDATHQSSQPSHTLGGKRDLSLAPQLAERNLIGVSQYEKVLQSIRC